MKWLKALTGLLVVSAAGAAVAGKVSRDKKRQQELDEFLLPSEEEPIVIDIPKKMDGSLKNLQDDILSFDENCNEDSVILSFRFDDDFSMITFRDMIENEQVSVIINEEDKVVDVLYSGSHTETEHSFLLNALVEACQNTSAEYLGYHITKE